MSHLIVCFVVLGSLRRSQRRTRRCSSPRAALGELLHHDFPSAIDVDALLRGLDVEPASVERIPSPFIVSCQLSIVNSFDADGVVVVEVERNGLVVQQQFVGIPVRIVQTLAVLLGDGIDDVVADPEVLAHVGNAFVRNGEQELVGGRGFAGCSRPSGPFRP